MSGVPDYTLEDTLDFKFTTRQFSTGAPFAFASGAIEIYEDNSITQITGAETLTLEFDGVTGLHNLRVAATAVNGFENGKSYHCVVSVGTVDSVSVVGEIVQQFSIGRSAAAVDLANGTDGLGAIKDETALIVTDTNEIQGKLPTNKFMGSSDGADDDGTLNTISTNVSNVETDTQNIQSRLPGALSNGMMDANVERWLDTAVSAGTAGIPNVNVTAIDNITTAALTLGDWLGKGTRLTSDSGTTTTLTDAGLTQADDHWNGSLLIFRTGTNSGYTATVTDFDAASDTITFTPAVPNAVTAGMGFALIPGLGWSDVQTLLGDAQSAIDLKDFADAGYDPVTNKVEGVKLVDTVTTLTGHTVQTGDSFARLGAPAGVSIAADLLVIDNFVDGLETTIGVAGAGLTDITLNAASIDLVWDEVLTGGTHNVPTSSGRRLRQIEASFVITAGTAQAGTANTIQLAAGESVSTDIFAGDRVIISGGTGVGEHGIVTTYNGTTKVCTMSQNWTITPDATSEYELAPADVDIETWQHAIVTVSSTTNLPEVDVKSISDDATAAGNLELDYDGTGYAKTNSTIGTTTTNTDMRGTDSALLATNVPTNFADMLIEVTTGHVGVDVLEWLGTAVAAATAGRPDVNIVSVFNNILPALILERWLNEGKSSIADSGTTTTLVDASLSEADDRWNGALLVFTSGTNNGYTAIVTDFDAATDTLTFTPAVPNAVTTEAFVLLPGLGWGARDLANATDGLGAIKAETALIVADTNELQTDDIPTLIAALNDISVTNILTTQMTEAYAADGSAPTMAQALMMIQQLLGEFAISGTTLTLKKVDGATTAATFTLDDATNPTSLTRAT